MSLEKMSERDLKYLIRDEVRDAVKDLLPELLRKAFRDHADREIVDPIVSKILRALK